MVKTIDIIGENHFEQWTKTRTACRGVVVRNGKMLLSYENLTDQWMIPGGGIENGEDEAACCIREVAEETGFFVQPSECLLEIDEYYEDWKWVNRYFVCKITGETAMHLTEREKAVGMEPRWLPIEEIKSIFRMHQKYAETDEMRRGMYLREYTALCELEGEFKQRSVTLIK
jgi:ADP-ribose pyrophosphatase YjhB (NUDIX family)